MPNTAALVMFIASILLTAFPAFAQAKMTVFRDVTVIPMDSDRALPHATVLVEGGKIMRVGPSASVAVPAGVRVIDGRGKFLIPGLADMHMHVDRTEELPLFLAAGVTTTLNMGEASPRFLTETQYQVEHGQVVGPQLFFAFLMDGPGDPGPEFVPVCEPDARRC